MQKVITKKQILQIQKVLKSKHSVSAAYIFGSVNKGKSTETSDLDIGLVCFDKNRLSPVLLGEAIGKIVPQSPVDLTIVDLSDNPLVLIQIINGKIIYQKEVLGRINLETRILQLYEDNKALKKIRDFYLEKSFREGIYAN